jgi:hypothetical protein
MRLSLKELTRDYRERAELDSDTLLGVSCRDRRIRELATAMNETISSLRKSYHSYKQGDEKLKVAITNIAHDIRTPLTAICGYLELAERMDKTPELRKYLDIINERALYMKKLVEELFEYSVINSRNNKEEMQDVNVNQVLEDSIMNLYPSFLEYDIDLKADISEKEVIRKLYPSYVERIFNNLLSNAIKYSDGDLEVTLTENGKLTMRNSASSLDKVKVGKLFERFYTVENADKNSAGLGLSIVQSFAEKMNCPINADYVEGKLVIEIEF